MCEGRKTNVASGHTENRTSGWQVERLNKRPFHTNTSRENTHTQNSNDKKNKTVVHANLPPSSPILSPSPPKHPRTTPHGTVGWLKERKEFKVTFVSSTTHSLPMGTGTCIVPKQVVPWSVVGRVVYSTHKYTSSYIGLSQMYHVVHSLLMHHCVPFHSLYLCMVLYVKGVYLNLNTFHALHISIMSIKINSIEHVCNSFVRCFIVVFRKVVFSVCVRMIDGRMYLE